MRQLTLGEVKKEELKLLLSFDMLAKANNIKYSLAYGTLLGAVRHKGFIPWDDDIDVVVPRPDYERLLSLIKSGKFVTDGFIFQGYELGNFPMPFLKLANEDIEVHDIANKPSIPLRLWIDIFPLDGVVDSIEEYRELNNRAQYWKNIIKAGNYRFFGAGKGLSNRLKKMAIKPAIAMLDLSNHSEAKIISAAKSGIAYGDATYVANVVWGPYGMGERFKKELFDKTVLVEFEGYQLPALAGWNEYLASIYGDYMQLPPIEQRTSHGVEAWIKDDSNEK